MGNLSKKEKKWLTNHCDYVRDIRIECYNLKADRGLTFRQLQTLTGIPRTSLQDMLNGKSNGTMLNWSILYAKLKAKDSD